VKECKRKICLQKHLRKTGPGPGCLGEKLPEGLCQGGGGRIVKKAPGASFPRDGRHGFTGRIQDSKAWTCRQEPGLHGPGGPKVQDHGIPSRAFRSGEFCSHLPGVPLDPFCPERLEKGVRAQDRPGSDQDRPGAYSPQRSREEAKSCVRGRVPGPGRPSPIRVDPIRITGTISLTLPVMKNSRARGSSSSFGHLSSIR